MKIKSREYSNGYIIFLEGILRKSDVVRLEERIVTLFREYGNLPILDVKELEYIKLDSLEGLSRIERFYSSEGGVLRFTNVRKDIYDLLSLAGLSEFEVLKDIVVLHDECETRKAV